jgi:glycosyltransferase involved in cell wall biosynthesis
MATLPRVSVVIPFYRNKDEVSYALKSLSAEAHLIHEVVLVDDASPEPLEVMPPETLLTKTRLIRLECNVGSSAARQAGVDHATGDLIAFLDSDDAWLPGKLAAQLPLFETDEPLLAVATGWQVVDVDRRTMTTRFPVGAEDAVSLASGCWFCPGSTVVVRREAFTRIGDMNGGLRRLEDLEWFLRLGLSGGRLIVVPMVGAVIRRAAKNNLVNVKVAASTIAERFTTMPGIDPAVCRALAAWLDAELAFAYWTEARVPTALWHMFKSMMRAPRLQFQLRSWWRIEPAVLSRAEVDTVLGTQSRHWP